MTGVLAGSPLYVVENKEDEDRLKPLVESEIKSAIINNTDSNGVILRCDTIGSIEAIMDLLKKSNVPVQSADIGQITRRDVIASFCSQGKGQIFGSHIRF